MPKYQVDVDGQKYLLESDQELSGAELQLAAQQYAGGQSPAEPRASRMPTMNVGWPNTQQAIENWRQPMTGNYLMRSLKAPVRAGMVGLGVANDIIGAPMRAMAPTWGGNPQDPETHPLDVLTPAAEKIPNYPLREQALMGIDAGKMVLDPTNLFGTGVGAKIMKANPAAEALKAQRGISDYGKALARELKPKGQPGIVKTLAEPLMNQRGNVNVPDIDDLAKMVDEKAPEGFKTARQVREAVGKPIKGPPLSGIENWEADALAQPINAKYTTPFPEYAVQARESKDRRLSEMTPYDLAGKRGVKAAQKVDEMLGQFGQMKTAALEERRTATMKIAPIIKKWNRLLAERLGVKIVDGKIVDSGGRTFRRPTEAGQIMQVQNKLQQYIDNPQYDPFLMEWDDIKGALNDIAYAPHATQLKQINTITEGIAKELAKDIDAKIAPVAGPKYQYANQNYSRLKKIEDYTNRALGQVSEDGVANKGASIMKSAIQSNMDNGKKAWFRAMKEITGIDLMQEAAYADIAMRAVDDERANNLLKSWGVTADQIASLAGGKAHVVMSAAKTIAKPGIRIATGQNPFGDKLDRLVRYYNTQQWKNRAQSNMSPKELQEWWNKKAVNARAFEAQRQAAEKKAAEKQKSLYSLFEEKMRIESVKLKNRGLL
jgi:hypothetical protein